MKTVYQTILLILLVIAMCFAGCSTQRGCGTEHYNHRFTAWKIIKIDTLKTPHAYTVWLRKMDNFIKTTCYCDCLPDSVKVGAYITL